jgi:predicted Rossmann fold flavoprotein
MRREFDVLIIGAGAAGLMTAIHAGKRGRRVGVLERAGRTGKKILISGGGRCNFTNLHCRPENFISANPHFAKSALASHTPSHFIELVEKHGIRYHEKTLGQLFCNGSAQEIVCMLETECNRAGVRILTNIDIERVEHGGAFSVFAGTDEFQASALVVSTGGLSIPKMGATSFGYDLARQFGLKIVETRPALVPLAFGGEDRKRYADLSGVSAEITASIGRQSFREKMLFTHRGLSGPAILQISSYWRSPASITIDLAPDRQLTAAMQNGSRRDLNSLKSAFRAALPHRVADRWLDLHPPEGWTNHKLAELERLVHNWVFVPEATDGYDKAEVTSGGVDTNELSSGTMESRKVSGLYFVGEVVDVTGHLGGFNFQWAWSSGFCAGQAV